MKTIKKIILAISVAAFALPALSACDDEFEYTFIDPIEYTAAAPVVEYIHVRYDSYWKMDYNTGKRELIFEPDDPNTKFITEESDVFTEYYRENYGNKNMFFLNYGVEPHMSLSDPATYIAYECDELRFVEQFRVYDEELGSYIDPPGVASGIWCSFVSVCVIKPLKAEYTGDEFYYEFGNNHNGIYSKYANIYCGEECFATFYYDPCVPISQEWFENYLNKNLIWGNAYENL